MGGVAFFFSGWDPILRILFVGTGAYFFLLITLRVSGSRTLAKTNLFDLIVSIGIGSAFGRVLTAKEVALTEACTAFVVLVSLQYIVSLLRSRSKKMESWIDARPRLLFLSGRYDYGAMREERIDEADIREVVRMKGYASMTCIEAVVLEGGGTLSVLAKSDGKKDLIESLLSHARSEPDASTPL